MSYFAFYRQGEHTTTNFFFSFWILQSLSMKRTLIEDLHDYTRRGFARFSKYRTLTRCFIGNAKVDNSEIKVISPMRASISRPAQVVMHFLHHAFLFDWPILGWYVRAWLKELRQVFFAVTVNKTQV